LKSASLIVIPLFIMLTASLINLGSLTDETHQYALATGNYTVNEQEAGLEAEPFSFTYTTIVIVILTTFIAIATVASLKVFGSGMGETGVKIIFVCGVALAIWGILSALSLSLFLGIPVFGIPIYFALSISYIVGIVTTVGGNG